MNASGIVTLTTDFGLHDSYVGVLKGVMLQVFPGVRLVDISHTIPPQDMRQAAYLVETFLPYFPAGTVHLVVVDPEVGAARRGIAIQTPTALFVGPDNGVLAPAWDQARQRAGAHAVAAVELRAPQYWLPVVSSTFHGRDIFAPVAAHLASGVPLDALGPRISDLHALALSAPERSGNTLRGTIVWVDHFGNCITDLRAEDLRALGRPAQLSVEVIGRHASLVRTYADGQPGELLALIGSSGRLEVAVRNGAAARTLGAGVGDVVQVTYHA